MGKLQKNAGISKQENINKLLSETQICKQIIDITYNDLNNKSKEEILSKQLETFESDYACDANSEKQQYGRVWFLVKKSDENFEVLQVAEAIDFGNDQGRGFFSEIFCHITEMFEGLKKIDGNIYSGFAKELKENETLSFYEVDVEEYLKKYAPSNYKEFIYKMACGYFAEASIAYFTQAREWGFYNSGMDKRAYYYIVENIHADNINEQKE